MQCDPIHSIDQQWNTACQTNDHAILAQLLADDWIAINGHGQLVTKADILAQVADVPWPFTNAAFQTISCRQSGDIAVVIGRLTGRGQVSSQEIAVEQYYTRSYIVRDHCRQAIATQATIVQTDA